MDTAMLNSPERLDGLALIVWPCCTGKVTPSYSGALTRMPVQHACDHRAQLKLGSEVWGVLYRIPRRVTENTGY